ncbi:DUF3781 domain-containing protein [Pseudobutyrivibrio xylanivorans]|uniref:DUF3781 domain-containing protein n=1 Tax=Pseudobutyrivibrio xylanivorans TaxID=185007 RepID=A0A1G5RYJ9_PSEXY|nr:DUF3781 domain-containing protein [Pseudobutyrivibrio xylanivorans]SCZ79194.1 Protein of unknown function [Pseudobutyrivibrio xylanivorans]
MGQKLIDNIDRVHTTEMGVCRIRRNLGLGDIDVVAWCKEKILDPKSRIERQGKNWYVHMDGCVITVNASSYTIITGYMQSMNLEA